MASQFRRSRFTPTPVGGTVMFGINKLSVSGQDLSALVNDKAGAAAGKLLQTIALGPMTNDLGLLLWTGNIVLHVKTFKALATYELVIAVRDASVQPGATDAQFADAAAGTEPGLIINALPVNAVGNFVRDAVLTTGSPPAQTTLQVNVFGSDVDSYGNTVSKGDSMVADFGIQLQIANPSNVGTYDLTAWISALFS